MKKLYDYKCLHCNNTFEAMCETHGTKAPRCPVCQEDSSLRVVSGFAMTGGRRDHTVNG